jgi:hypothetical protein
LKFRQHGEVDLRTGLALLEREDAIANVLPAEPHHVAAAQAGIEQKREREPGLRSYGVPLLE